jgi:hypothetical protein
LDDLGADGKILKWILGKLGENVWTGFIWLRMGTSAFDSCEMSSDESKNIALIAQWMCYVYMDIL